MKKVFMVVLIVLSLVGCSSLKVNVDYDPDYDFSAPRSYAIAHHARAGEDTLFNDRLIKALNEELAAKGYVQVPKQEAQLIFVFHTNVVDKTQIDTDYEMIGYRRYGFGGHMIATTSTYTYTEGTLILDALNPQNQKIVWRGTATDILSKKKSPEERTAYVKKVVHKTMQDFPPKSERK